MIPALVGASLGSGTPPSNYYSLQTYTVGSGGSASITFSSIDQTFTHLQIRALVQSTRTTYGDGYFLRLNSNSGNNYSWHQLDGDGASPYAGAATSQTAGRIGTISGATATNMFSANVIDIFDYTNTNKYKTVRSLFGFDTNNTGSVGGRVGIYSSLFMNSGAVTTITIYPEIGPNFSQYSSFALYGVK